MVRSVTNENPDCALVTLFLHNRCNYSCDYCNTLHRDGSHGWPQDAAPFVTFLDRVRQRNPHIYVEFLGGEPTLWPRFRDFVNGISDANTYIEFSTNASRSLRYWEAWQPGPMYVMMSWHSAEANDDHFAAVAEILQHRVSCGVALMVTPDNFTRAQALASRLERLDIEILPRFVREEIGSTVFLGYTDEQRAWITGYRHLRMRPHAIDWPLPVNLHLDGQRMRFPAILDQGLHAFRGMRCEAGVRRFYVDVDGEINRCSRKVGGSLGNIHGDYSLPPRGVICDQDLCPCKWDALAAKSSDVNS